MSGREGGDGDIFNPSATIIESVIALFFLRPRQVGIVTILLASTAGSRGFVGVAVQLVQGSLGWFPLSEGLQPGAQGATQLSSHTGPPG